MWRQKWKMDGAALLLVGIVATLRVVVGWVLRAGNPPGGVEVFGFVPLTGWGWAWGVTAVMCFASLWIMRIRPLAVAVSCFAFTSWSINWAISYATLDDVEWSRSTLEYLLMSSSVGNIAIAALLVWGLARGTSTQIDLPTGEIVETEPRVKKGTR